MAAKHSSSTLRAILHLPRYCLGLLTLVGKDPMVRSNWKKIPNPVFEVSSEHETYGPGRGTFALAKDGTDWLLYAAKATAEPTAAHRQTRAQTFTRGPDGTPLFGVPEAVGPIHGVLP
jgi:GH43 family beta-xylosidase